MKCAGDSSILKSLAVAFADGLAFGVGVKIAQSPARKRAESAPAELLPAPAATPESVESLDLQLPSKLLATIDARLSRHMANLEQRLARSEDSMGAGLKALEARQAQQGSNSQAALEEIHAALTERVAGAERAAQSVESRVAGFIEAAVEARAQEYLNPRVQALEQRLHRDITEAGDRTAKLLVQTIETKLLSRIEMLEGEVRRQAGTISSLRTAVDSSRQRLHDLLVGLGGTCQEAARDLEKPLDPGASGGPGPSAGAGGGGTPAQGEADDRRFDSLQLVNPARSEKKLPIPLVSSMF